MKLAALALTATLAAQTGAYGADNHEIDARGIFVDNGQPDSTAIRFSVLLERDGVQKVVPSNFAFKSGDKMKFRFELNHDRYIYILLHSVAAEPSRLDSYSGTRGIEVIRDEERRAPTAGSFQMLYPTLESGANNRAAAHTVHTVPSAGPAWFRMDRHPGMEKLFVVVSATPVDFSPYFDLRSGKLKVAMTSGRGVQPSDSDLIARLGGGLVEYSGNSRVAETRGIEIETYAAAQNVSRPMLVPVDLRHASN